MKTLVIYTSQTGFTKRYAKWIAEALGADLSTIEDARKKSITQLKEYDALIYGGWAVAGKISKSEWFLKLAENLKDKRLALFCVGATPAGAPEIDEAMSKVLTLEQADYIKVFYCPGGIDYDKMNLPSKLAMKALASILRKSKEDKKQEQARIISSSYDISDKKYIQPIVEYFEGGK